MYIPIAVGAGSAPTAMLVRRLVGPAAGLLGGMTVAVLTSASIPGATWVDPRGAGIPHDVPALTPGAIGMLCGLLLVLCDRSRRRSRVSLGLLVPIGWIGIVSGLAVGVARPLSLGCIGAGAAVALLLYLELPGGTERIVAWLTLGVTALTLTALPWTADTNERLGFAMAQLAVAACLLGAWTYAPPPRRGTPDADTIVIGVRPVDWDIERCRALWRAWGQACRRREALALAIFSTVGVTTCRPPSSAWLVDPNWALPFAFEADAPPSLGVGAFPVAVGCAVLVTAMAIRGLVGRWIAAWLFATVTTSLLLSWWVEGAVVLQLLPDAVLASIQSGLAAAGLVATAASVALAVDRARRPAGALLSIPLAAQVAQLVIEGVS